MNICGRQRWFALITLAVWLGAWVCQAQVEPEFNEAGWFNAVERSTLGEEGEGGVSAAGSAPALAEASTPEIEALARGLENDPARIFRWVHDHIRHVLYFGSKKGAQLTLLERSGNDFDQTALLVALLRAAGQEVSYEFGLAKMPFASTNQPDLRQWLGLSVTNADWTVRSNYLRALLDARGYPVLPNNAFFYSMGDSNTVAFHRVWVKWTVATNTYYLDPAFKPIVRVTNLVDLTTAMELDLGEILTTAGGSSTADYVQYLNESALRGRLVEYTTNLLGVLQSTHPNASVAEILGGERITPATAGALPTSQPFQLHQPGALSLLEWEYQPTALMAWLKISFQGASQQWFLPELQGQRLSLTFSNQGQARLWLEDEVALLYQTTGSLAQVIVTQQVNHPFGRWRSDNTFQDSTWQDHTVPNTAYRRTNATYALVYGVDAEGGLLRRRQEKLAALRQQEADTSARVVAETLNVMGLEWLWQGQRVTRLLAGQAGVLDHYHHRFGRMGQESGNGYYLDVFMQLTGLFPGNGNAGADYARRDATFDLLAYFLSGLEHGLIEQFHGTNLGAASTVKMLQLANTNQARVYLAHSNNWATITNQFSDYPVGGLNWLRGNYINRGYYLLLPQDGAQTVAGAGSWSGYGAVARFDSPTARGMTMLINGGHLGGYAPLAGATVNPIFVAQNFQFQPATFNLQPPALPTLTVGDPVNIADGSFTVDESDLRAGQAEPRGFALTRHYSSARRHHNPTGLGPGWTHHYNFRAADVSAPSAALGETTPPQMAALVVATRAALALYSTNPEPKNWALTTLIAKWGVDQLINNAVSVTLGADTVQFIKQPDGTFTPPAGSTLALTKTNSAYRLHERHGNTFLFDPAGRLTNLVDQSNQSLKFTYGTGAASNWVATATDWKNRVLTFNYSGTPLRLTSVSSSATGTVNYAYTSNGLQLDLTAVTDPENQTHTFRYDTNHQIVEVSNALGRVVTTNFYDGFGRVIEQYSEGDPTKRWRFFWADSVNMEENPAGDRRRFFYDEQHRLTAQENALGHVARTFYDGQDHVVMTVSPLNETNRFEYDGRHNRLRAVDALGFTNHFAYDALDRLTVTVDARGASNRFGYNAKHQLIGSTNGAGDWITFGYDASSGLLTGRTNAAGATAYAYDANGHLSRIIHPNSLGSEGFLNNTRGEVLSHTNARGFVTSFQYNQRRELTNTVAPTNVTAKIAYDAVGDVRSATDPRGFTSSNTWSAARKLLATYLPETTKGVPVVTNTYDTRDWLVRTVNPMQQAVTNAYDAAGRLFSVTDPLLHTTKFGYDAVGRQTSATNAANEVTRQQWSPRGEVTRTVDGANRAVGRAFDPAGNQIILTNRNGKLWQFQYDDANRLTNTVTPLNRETRVAYDARGLVSTVREPSGQWTTNFYDAKGRLTNITDAVGVRWFSYDPNDNLTLLTNVGQASRLAWTYNAYDRVSSFTNAEGYVLQYRYDQNGNLTNLIYPGNRVVKYAYDSLNRLTNVTDWANRPTTFDYDLASRLRTISRPNGTVRELHYDAAGQTTNIIERMANGVPIAFFKLGWTNIGRVEWEFAAPLPHAYTPPARTMEFDEDNRLKKFNGSNVAHDEDGNLTNGPGTNNTFINYGYNARNQLTNAAGVAYAYDPGGNRTSLSNATGIAKFVINPNAALSQVLMRIKGGTTNYYIHGLGLLYEITETATSTNTATYHYDYRGSTVALTDASGYAITDRLEYSPYATLTYRLGTNDTPFLYNGRYGVQTDPNGLLHMRARYYNPHLCRFLNADPAGFGGGLNFYAFADGNPVSMMDPFGLGAGGVSDNSSWLRSGWNPDTYHDIGAAWKNDLNNSYSWPVAGALGTLVDLGAGMASTEFFGAGAGTFSANPSLQTTPLLLGDIATGASLLAGGLSPLPSANAALVRASAGRLVGITDAEASALARQIHAIQVDGQPAVVSVEAFGSRAGSTYRAAPTFEDLDIRITLSAPEHFGAVVSEVQEVGALFQAAKRIRLEPVYVIPGVPPPVLLDTPFILLKP